MLKLAVDPEAFKAKLLEVYPDRQERSYWIAAGLVFCFVHLSCRFCPIHC